MENKPSQEAFAHFFDIIRRLRAPDGCPWDRDQTPMSLRSTFIEETFEAIDAISADDSAHVREELGDALLNVILIAYMYEQAGDWTVAQMIQDIADKLVRRHPHVFKNSAGKAFLHDPSKTPDAGTPEDVLVQWDEIKAGLEKRQHDSVMDEVPGGFPPLLKAYKIQKKAAKQGFDWNDTEGPLDKLKEEIREVEEARKSCAPVNSSGDNSPEPFTVNAAPEQNAAQLRLEEEVGDAFFSLVNWSRKLGVDPSAAMERASQKFARRFREVEKQAKASGKPMKEHTLEELDRYWDKAKAAEGSE
jgi:tetrapyrrole methylase family protein/MazG family protein